MPRKPRALKKKSMAEWYALAMQVLIYANLKEWTHRNIRKLTKERFLKHLTDELEEKL